jgi:hypothetical protein
MQYTIQKNPNSCSTTSIRCYPLDELKNPTIYGIINTRTAQSVIYFVELGKIDFKTPNLKLYSSDLVYLRTDFPNIEAILEEVAPKSVKSSARYRRTVEMDGVNYYCFRAKRFDYDFTHYYNWFFLETTDEMLKEAYPHLKFLYRAGDYIGTRPQSKLEVLEMLARQGIKIVPSPFKRTKDYFIDEDIYIGNIFDSEKYYAESRSFNSTNISQRLIRLIQSINDNNTKYGIKSVLDRVFGINDKANYSTTKERAITNIKCYRAKVNFLKALQLMIVSTALKNPDTYFEIIESIIIRRSLNEYNPNVMGVIDYIYKMAIEDRLLTDNDVSNIANILRGEPTEDTEIEAGKADEVKLEKVEVVKVEKIDLKPIERKVINLEELYKAKIASR